MHKMHSEELGLNIPKDYFSKSKIEILEKVANQKKSKFTIFSRERILWSVAASIAIILSWYIVRPYFLSIVQQPAYFFQYILLYCNTKILKCLLLFLK